MGRPIKPRHFLFGYEWPALCFRMVNPKTARSIQVFRFGREGSPRPASPLLGVGWQRYFSNPVHMLIVHVANRIISVDMLTGGTSAALCGLVPQIFLLLW